MRARRAASGGQRGFTLVEMIITALISGILAVVVARLFLGAYTGWLFNYSALIAQQKSRIFRDSLIKNVRQAKASSVQVSRVNGNQPPRSLLTFTDVAGNNWAFYQFNNEARMGRWVQSGPARVINSYNVAIPSKLDRLIFYHPNVKDLRKLNFAFDLEWTLLADNKMKPISIQMVGEIEIRDP